MNRDVMLDISLRDAILQLQSFRGEQIDEHGKDESGRSHSGRRCEQGSPEEVVD